MDRSRKVKVMLNKIFLILMNRSKSLKYFFYLNLMDHFRLLIKMEKKNKKLLLGVKLGMR